MRRYFGAEVKKTFNADAREIIMKSGDIGVEYADNIEKSLARGDEATAEKFGNDLARFLKNALRKFRISTVEYDRAMEELESLVVVKEENE